MFNIPQSIHSVKCVRAVFEDSGISVAEWARAKGFSTSLVYQVLEGRRKCIRGQSHQIAVALGIKQGSIVSIQELIARLG
ncbi:MAG: DNA-binding protein [Gammaproteobacteria bacterium]|nr:DNA-binding protein [Gammaproteobacteria bacterium]MBU1602458.1 DNA-binding protein [Gammaproteobacteria bacterium]MBU2433263.1 DNA-binding protein [Gammaproteobacteria bacterium]MBU2451179.1 DNA-binding protein [Gammaproteobacteria bacterium]